MKNGIILRMYFMCMFEIKCVMYKRWQILPFHAKDIVEKIKRNIKKLFKNCVYEHIVWVHIYHQFNLGLRKVNQYNEGKSKMILYFYLYSPCFMHYYSNYLSSIDHKLSITTENSFSCKN